MYKFILVLFLSLSLSSSLQAASEGALFSLDNLTTGHGAGAGSGGRPLGTLRQIIGIRDNFKEKVQIWESIKGRRMTKQDLIDPYIVARGLTLRDERTKKIIKVKGVPQELRLINPVKCCRELTDLDTILSSPREKRKWQYLLQAMEDWSNIEYIFIQSKNPYDLLFSFQIALESIRLGDYENDAMDGITTHLHRLDDVRNPAVPEVIYHLSDWNCPEVGDLYCELIGEDPEMYRRGPTALGLLPVSEADMKKVEETKSLPLKSVGVVTRSSTMVDTEPFWKYLHTVPGKGFSVFLHMFPTLREDIVDFEAYGIASTDALKALNEHNVHA